MALTPSTMVSLGSSAPEFQLPDTVSGETLSLKELKGEKATVVAFICNHCPYVIHINEGLVAVAKEWQARGVRFVAISSNDAESYPEDGPEKMKEHARKVGYPFPYLYDESQKVAQAYQAACTPDFFVYDSELKLVYRGQMDDSRPGNDKPVTGKDLGAALEAIVSGQVVEGDQFPSMGCNIKWKGKGRG